MKERANTKKQEGRWAEMLLSLCLFTFLLLLTGCFGGKHVSATGGEVTGVSGRAFNEPAPYGMTLIKRGHLKELHVPSICDVCPRLYYPRASGRPCLRW